MNKTYILIIAVILAIPTFGFSILVYSILNDLNAFGKKKDADLFLFEITLINSLSKKCH